MRKTGGASASPKKPGGTSAAKKAAASTLAKKPAGATAAKKPVKKAAAKPKSGVVKKEETKGTKANAAEKEAEAERLEAEAEARRAAHNKEVNDRLKAEREAKEAEAKARQAELLPDANGIRRVGLTRLQECVQLVLDEGKTPLISDPAGGADTFFKYQHALTMNTKNIFLKVGVHKTTSQEDMKDEMRHTVVNCLKNGQTLHLQMENGATDLNVYDSEDCFPLKKIFTPNSLNSEEKCSKLVRDKDKDSNGFFIPKPDFYVVATTLFEEEDLTDFLKESIPLDLCGIIIIKPSQ
mmetsp:Transcript_50196/g.98398  ORF Transcript_50196/g.98398 Transcript_50196/m.98398 type:complete len:295 (-) Transcript_50196:165-1049(-)